MRAEVGQRLHGGEVRRRGRVPRDPEIECLRKYQQNHALPDNKGLILNEEPYPYLQ